MVARLLLFCGSLCMAEQATDWMRFRGPNGSGVADIQTIPTHFGPQRNLLWKTEVPPGHSSPILVGNHVFLTAFGPGELYTICLDRQTGKESWRRTIPRAKPAAYHANNNPASATPASDGKRIFVFFQEAGLFAYSLDGRRLWEVPIALPQTVHGMGASPIVAAGLVILNCDLSNGPSFLLAVDHKTGDVRWKIMRGESGPLPGYATPVIQNAAQIIVPGSLEWSAYSLQSGAKLWGLPGMPMQPKSSAIVKSEIVFGSAPAFAEGATEEAFSFSRFLALDRDRDRIISRQEADVTARARVWFQWADKNRDGLITEEEWNSWVASARGVSTVFAVRPGSETGEPRLLWIREMAVPYVTTPIHYRGVLFLIKEGGLLTSIDPKSGEVFKRARIPGAQDQFFASPVAAAGKLILTSQAGHLVTVSAAPQWDVLAVNDLQEECYATPAVAEGRLYVRTTSALYCFGSPN